jgi:hypothetical protein
MHIDVMLAGNVYNAAGLLLFGLGGNRLQVFGFEDLPAIEALHVVHAVSTGEDDCILMVAGGLHN